MKKFLGIGFGFGCEGNEKSGLNAVSLRHALVLGICPQFIFLAVPGSAVYQQELTCWLGVPGSHVSWLVAWSGQWEALAGD